MIDTTSPTGSTGPALLELRDVTKSFGPVRALDGVSMRVHKGEVIGLIGENGAGKSTLLNIICGTETASSGRMEVRGRPMWFDHYHQASLNGVYRVFQELALLPNLTVWENLFFGHERLLTRGGLIRRSSAIRRATSVLERFGHGWINPRKQVGDLPFATQQVIEILRAFALSDLLDQPEPILLLDEPTAGLASDEIEFLRQMIETVRPFSSVVFVSHRLTELIEWSSTVVVLKDGRTVCESPSSELSEGELHRLMVGRARSSQFSREDEQREPEERVLLDVRGLGDSSTFRSVDLQVAAGEILGIAGVLGSGKSELGRAIYGAHPVTHGAVSINGEQLRTPYTIRDLMRHRVGYIPPERKEDGLLDTFSVARNISFASIVAQPGQLLDLRGEAEHAREYVDKLSIKTHGIDSSILTLSGGNQQKVLLARWLARGVRLLIVDNPTRGVDAGAKEQVYQLLRDVAREGVGIILISDDLLEAIGLSNRIVVMRDGEISRIVPAPVDDKPTETDLVSLMV